MISLKEWSNIVQHVVAYSDPLAKDLKLYDFGRHLELNSNGQFLEVAAEKDGSIQFVYNHQKAGNFNDGTLADAYLSGLLQGMRFNHGQNS